MGKTHELRDLASAFLTVDRELDGESLAHPVLRTSEDRSFFAEARDDLHSLVPQG